MEWCVTVGGIVRLKIGTTKSKPVSTAVDELRNSICYDGNINSHLSRVDVYDLSTAYRMFTDWLRHLPESDDSYYMDYLFKLAVELSWITGPPLDTTTAVNEDITTSIFAEELADSRHKEILGGDVSHTDYVAVEIIRILTRVLPEAVPATNIMCINLPLLWIWTSSRVTIHIGVIDDSCPSNES